MYICISHFILRCLHEYMDIYAEIQSSDPAELINSPFSGRHCGPIPPRRRVSLYRAIALSFFTTKNITTPDVFEGTYGFINESEQIEVFEFDLFFNDYTYTAEYEVGTPVVGSPCSYIVNFAQKRTGVIVSPTYPGKYYHSSLNTLKIFDTYRSHDALISFHRSKIIG